MSALPQGAIRRVADCWNQIGVRGDGSCPELKGHIHCRNCPVYAAGAVELLGVECSAGLLSERTQGVGEPQHTDELASNSLLVFRLGTEWLALRSSALKEVASQRPIHSLPHRRGSVRGLTNIRGELLVCIALERIIGTEPAASVCAPETHTTIERLLVLDHTGERVVFAVDEVLGVQRFSSRELMEIAAGSSRARKSYLRASLAWRDKTIGVLDEDRLFQSIAESLPLVAKC